jgi:NAD(P)-dependent dehydrogenase (short-subunit alcohol dehydrogenase family)
MTTAPTPARTVVLTGAASPRGIGLAVARRLAAEGSAVAILDVRGAEEAAAAIAEESGVPALGLSVDVTDVASVDAAYRRVEAELPPATGLVNLAGIASPTPFLEITPEEWDRVFEVNVKGAFLVTQRALPAMIEAGTGRIVNLSSISAQRGGGTFSKVAYSAAKAGIIGFTRAVAREVGEHGITVNAVAPGPVDTDIMGGTLSDERKAALSADSLMKRVASREEVAALICFLLGPDAGIITAATYDINGGLQIS